MRTRVEVVLHFPGWMVQFSVKPRFPFDSLLRHPKFEYKSAIVDPEATCSGTHP